MSDVCIILFAANGFDKGAQGLAGAGRRLAEELGGSLRAVVVGEGAEAVAGAAARVADAVVVAEQAELREYQPETYLNALAQLCGESSPRAVVVGEGAEAVAGGPRGGV